MRRLFQTFQEFVNDLVLLAQPRHNGGNAIDARAFQGGEHVSLFDVVMHRQDLAALTAKRPKGAQVLRHIKRKHDITQVFWRAVACLDPFQHCCDTRKIGQIATMDRGEVTPLASVCVCWPRAFSGCRSQRWVLSGDVRAT